MRRNRMRSFTIYGENEEEYIKEYEKTKSRLSQMIFNKNEIKESLQEDEEDDLGFQKKQSFHFNNLDEEDDSDLGALNNDDDEELIGHEYDNQENHNCSISKQLNAKIMRSIKNCFEYNKFP